MINPRSTAACQRKGFGPETSYYQTVMKYGSIQAAAKANSINARTLTRRLWVEASKCGSCGVKDIDTEVSVDKCEECYRAWKQCEEAWRSSKAGQEYNHDYVRTDGFKEKHKIVSLRYLSSEKGQEWYKNYIGKRENKVRHNEVNNRYACTPKGQTAKYLSNLRRRERQYLLDFEFTKEDATLVRSTFNNCCFVCGMTSQQHREKYETALHIDHFYPLSKGLGLTIDNAVLLCHEHNSNKGSKKPEDFFTKEQIIAINLKWEEMACQKL